MTERTNVARQHEVERLQLLLVWLAVVELRQWLHDRWTADRHSPNGGALFEWQRPCSKSQGSVDDVEPHLRNPRAIVAVQVGGIAQVPETMLVKCQEG